MTASTLEVAVTDSGYGISDEDQKKLFKTFGLGQDSKQKNIHGSGLGLNICKKIIDRLGGNIEIHSKLGKGTTVVFTFSSEEIQITSCIESEFSLPEEDSLSHQPHINLNSLEKNPGGKMTILERNDLKEYDSERGGE